VPCIYVLQVSIGSFSHRDSQPIVSEVDLVYLLKHTKDLNSERRSSLSKYFISSGDTLGENVLLQGLLGSRNRCSYLSIVRV
jgi:hypothetical protein